MKVIFISGPYKGLNSWEQECNIRKAEIIALQINQFGAATICPHTANRFYFGTMDEINWMRICKELLSRCDGIVMLSKWMHSEGANEELNFALNREIPIFYFDTYQTVEEHSDYPKFKDFIESI